MSDYSTIILRFIIFGALHSLFATTRVKHLISLVFGKEPRFYRLIYNLVSLVMFIWVMAAYRNSPVIYYAPGIWSLVMYLLQLVVAAMMFVCVWQTGVTEFLGLSRVPSSSGHLVTSGCYSVVRHPLYLLGTLFLFLNPVMTGQWLLLSSLSVMYFVIGALIEERRLIKTYGTEYLQYQRKVPILIPSMKSFKPRPRYKG